MNDTDRERLRHMLEAAREALSFTSGRSRDELTHDRMLLLALVKEFEIIGEAASKVSAAGRSAAPSIPWAQVTAMRNRLTHGYFDWDSEVIWATLRSNLPTLIVELEKALPAGE